MEGFPFRVRTFVKVSARCFQPPARAVQGLLTETPFEFPRHRASGVPMDRMLMVLAVLGRHTRARASRGYDVFVNVVGGLRLSDPGGTWPLGGGGGSGGHVSTWSQYTLHHPTLCPGVVFRVCVSWTFCTCSVWEFRTCLVKKRWCAHAVCVCVSARRVCVYVPCIFSLYVGLILCVCVPCMCLRAMYVSVCL
jgi:hypothetical protein